jgi:hypothetical protein
MYVLDRAFRQREDWLYVSLTFSWLCFFCFPEFVERERKMVCGAETAETTVLPFWHHLIGSRESLRSADKQKKER